MRNNYLTHFDNQDDVTIIPMGDEKGISVMILNKSKTNSIDYNLKLGNKKAGNSTLNIIIDAGLKTKLKSKIEAESTQMLIFNAKGQLIKKYTYSAKNADEKSAPLMAEF